MMKNGKHDDAKVTSPQRSKIVMHEYPLFSAKDHGWLLPKEGTF